MTTAAETYVDISPATALRIVVQQPDGTMVDLASADGDRTANALDQLIRIRACDLRAACRQTSNLHAEAAAQGFAVAVIVDIEVSIDRDVHAARKSLTVLDAKGAEDNLRYVGTAVGLAGLIADIHALRLADGVALVPLTPVARSLITAEVIPQLAQLGINTAPCPMDAWSQSTSDRFREALPAHAARRS